MNRLRHSSHHSNVLPLEHDLAELLGRLGLYVAGLVNLVQFGGVVEDHVHILIEAHYFAFESDFGVVVQPDLDAAFLL